jgi:hypothetical protein
VTSDIANKRRGERPSVVCACACARVCVCVSIHFVTNRNMHFAGNCSAQFIYVAGKCNMKRRLEG